MEQSELLKIVEAVLEVAPGTVSIDSDLKELDWDSLSDITFIAMIDEATGKSLDPLLLAAARTPADLKELLTEAS